MSFEDFMSKVRQLDNRCARWMMRHFYILFFEFVLVIIFFIFFYNTFRVIDLSTQTSPDNIFEQLLAQQATNTLIITMLLILNSFWMLFMFNGMNRIRILLREITYNISRRNKPNR
jgi:hypothetical protein